MTNRSKFRGGNIGHGRYFVVGAWLSNFCQSFSNLFGTFSSKMESLRSENGKKFWKLEKKV